jgi:hypothetical protein
MAAGSLPSGEESVRFNGTAEPTGALPDDKASDCAWRLFPNNIGRNKVKRIA